MRNLAWQQRSRLGWTLFGYAALGQAEQSKADRAKSKLALLSGTLQSEPRLVLYFVSDATLALQSKAGVTQGRVVRGLALHEQSTADNAQHRSVTPCSETHC